jgi:hypothetical protein
MAQCYCYSIYNDSPTTSYDYYYTDCYTGLQETGGVGPNSTVYTCSSGSVSSNGAIVSINANDTPCGGCECGCETFIGFNYKGAGGTISISYTNCGDFIGTIAPFSVPTSDNGGSNQSTYLFAEHFPFSEQPPFCVKFGTIPTHTDVTGGIGFFVPLFDGCCYTVNRCYSWTVNSGDILSTLLISYTNFEGEYINQVEVLTQISVTNNIDGTFTYYLCSSTEPQFFEFGEPVVPSFTVEQGGNCNSDLQCAPNIPYTVYLVSDCCEEKPDGYMYLPVGLNADQVVGSSTDNTCYKIVEGAEAIQNLDWDGSVFDPGECEECQTTNEYFCDPEPPTQTPTPTQTQTPTPTITPTPTLTPTPTSQPTIIYFQRCCNVGQYLGVSNYYGTIVSEYSYLSITIGANTFCVKTVPSVPYPVTLYDFNNIELNGYESCEVCKDEHPCPPPPTQQIMGYENECGVITIFPMSIECVSISPSTTESNDGRVSVSITGGTPPYKYTWEGDGIGNDSHAPAIDNVSIGDYTVTVVDYWGDFTATTTCTLTAYTDCYFSGTVSEFTPPTPTPTKTPTPTPTSIPLLCDCRYGTVGISQNDIDLYGTVYVSYLDCDGNCYCVTNGEIGDAKPYIAGIYTNDICIRKTTTTNSFDVSLYIIVDGEPQILSIDGDSYVTLGGCCTTPTQTPTPTQTTTPTPTITPSQTQPIIIYKFLTAYSEPFYGGRLWRTSQTGDNFAPWQDSFSTNRGVAVGIDGTLYQSVTQNTTSRIWYQPYPYTSIPVSLGTLTRRYGNIAIAPNGDMYAVTDNNAPTAGNVFKYNPSISDFEQWGGLPNRLYFGITVTPSNDVYVSVINGDIYKQTNGSGAFVALNQTNRSWRGMVSDLNGNIYACVYGGDIYKQTNGTGNFVSMGAGNRNWHSIMVSTDNYLYAAVRYGDVYKSPMNTVNFTSLNLGNKEWYAMTNKLY